MTGPAWGGKGGLIVSGSCSPASLANVWRVGGSFTDIVGFSSRNKTGCKASEKKGGCLDLEEGRG